MLAKPLNCYDDQIPGEGEILFLTANAKRILKFLKFHSGSHSFLLGLYIDYNFF